MKHIILAAILMVSVASCTKSAKLPAVSAPAHSPTSPGTDFKPAEKPADGAIVVESEPERTLYFTRQYSKKFLDGYTVRLTVDQGYGLLSKSGTVLQADGKWVVFNVDSPADRILMPQTLKDIQSVIPQMESMDAVWRNKGPDYIVDMDGRKWYRKP